MDHDLNAPLGGLRVEAREDFVEGLLARIEFASRPVPKRWPKAVAAGGVSAAMVAGLATVGGVSYAATAVTHAVKVVAAPATHKAPRQAITLSGLTAGGDQYRPGYGFGDPNHNHDGPPGLTRAGGENAPPLETRPAAGGLAKVAGTTVTFDEQAHLYISVVDQNGTPLLLTQQSKRGGTSIGGTGVGGPQTKFIQYVVRVPRPITFGLRIPENLLASGGVYRIRIVAIDPQGNKSTLLVPFRA
jgi:hypothetical protein